MSQIDGAEENVVFAGGKRCGKLVQLFTRIWCPVLSWDSGQGSVETSEKRQVPADSDRVASPATNGAAGTAPSRALFLTLQFLCNSSRSLSNRSPASWSCRYQNRSQDPAASAPAPRSLIRPVTSTSVSTSHCLMGQE
ncbi:uncharacterized protein LOC114022504 [Chelonia mydas]|uniref:uncharacterized protein LOC114022504 n=1 Tax=Chelonia mydas TaxID=8469 RepID=UPI0018A1CB89|nr:uncharacterized protein LOC114022504 [Chelonia mydas]